MKEEIEGFLQSLLLEAKRKNKLMSNCCNNKLTILGPYDKVSQFVQKAQGNRQTFKPSKWDLTWEHEKMIKCAAQGIPFESTLAPKPSPLSFQRLVPIPDEVMAREYDDPAFRDAQDNGHDWERRLWGVKWGASDVVFTQVNASEVLYKFQTPWGPAQEFFLNVSAQFPQLFFFLSFEEEYPSRGRFLFKNGNISEKMYNYGREKIPGEDNCKTDDERYDLYRQWRCHYVNKHDDWVKQYMEKYEDF